MLTAGFISLCWFGVEESLEAVELQVSGGDDDQTLESRPAVHISGVGLKQVEISAASHSLVVIMTPHVEDKPLQPAAAFLHEDLRNVNEI